MDSSIPTSSGIYRITCIVTGKFYIGSAVNLHRRLYHHFFYLKRNAHRNPKLQRAFNKYGIDAFTYEVLELVLIPEMLTTREQFFFDRDKPFGKRGYNIARIAGSGLGKKLSAEHRQKLREQHLGLKASAEARAKMSEARRGKKRKPETIEKMRLANIGRTISPEHRAKLRAYRTGRKLSPETIEKVRIAGTGKKRSAETSVRIGEANARRMKPIILIAPDGVEYTIQGGFKKFCVEHRLSHSALIGVAKGKCKQHKGWMARYPETNVS